VSVVSLTNMPLPHMFVVVESFQLATDTFAYVLFNSGAMLGGSR